MGSVVEEGKGRNGEMKKGRRGEKERRGREGGKKGKRNGGKKNQGQRRQLKHIWKEKGTDRLPVFLPVTVIDFIYINEDL